MTSKTPMWDKEQRQRNPDYKPKRTIIEDIDFNKINYIRSNLFTSRHEEFNSFVWIMLNEFNPKITIPTSTKNITFNQTLQSALNQDYRSKLIANKKYQTWMDYYFVYSLSEALFYGNIPEIKLVLESIFMGSNHIVLAFNSEFTIRLTIKPKSPEEYMLYVEEFERSTAKFIGTLVYPFMDRSNTNMLTKSDSPNYPGISKNLTKRMKSQNELCNEKDPGRNIEVRWFGVWEINKHAIKINDFIKNNTFDDLKSSLFDLYSRIITIAWKDGFVYDDLKFGNIGFYEVPKNMGKKINLGSDMEYKLFLIDYEFERYEDMRTGTIKITRYTVKDHFYHNFVMMVALFVIIESDLLKFGYQKTYELEYSSSIESIVGRLPGDAYKGFILDPNDPISVERHIKRVYDGASNFSLMKLREILI